MPEWIAEYLFPVVVMGGSITVIKWMLKGAEKSMGQRIDSLSSSMDGKLTAVRTEMEEIERDALKRSETLHGRVTDLAADLPREYVRRQEFEATVADVRERLGSMDRKLDVILTHTRG